MIEFLSTSLGFQGKSLTCGSTHGRLKMRFVFPRTAAKLNELDGATSFGAAILDALYRSGVGKRAVRGLAKYSTFALRGLVKCYTLTLLYLERRTDVDAGKSRPFREVRIRGVWAWPWNFLSATRMQGGYIPTHNGGVASVLRLPSWELVYLLPIF